MRWQGWLLGLGLALSFGRVAMALVPCTDEFPQIWAGSGPSSALTSLPLTYNYRMTCNPDGVAFVIGELRASYCSANAVLQPLQSLIISPIQNGGDYLYQALFLVPPDQAPGDYLITGCQVVKKTESGETRCVPIVPSPLRLNRRLNI